MSDREITFVCPRCGRTWSVDEEILLARLDEGYKSPVTVAAYRDACPICGTYAVTELKEDRRDA